ncbi:TetR/AcrR family transcriptional regulator [Lacisediminihabitans profunda]|uniref:TetR/AcrR family transcriptional regulator n=1 Tax=Lacisediminihabitans profunda TaxID=2594790 RepID=A0A5C8URH2_9MICO|nr:TetR/AcrR family transcriptional regulator [Lacisediminihabitans profunda]
MRYVNRVARKPDPERKPALLAQIVDFLLDKPLSALTFRTLASGLGVSTYTLVYHFGTRADLVREIVLSVSERQDLVVAAVQGESGDLEEHLANLRRSWELSLTERSQQLRRLEFEAATSESRQHGLGQITRGLFDRWFSTGVEALVRMGIHEEEATLEARTMVDTIYGLHYDLMVTKDPERVSAVFARVLRGYEARIARLAAEGAGELAAEGAGPAE